MKWHMGTFAVCLKTLRHRKMMIRCISEDTDFLNRSPVSSHKACVTCVISMGSGYDPMKRMIQGLNKEEIGML